MRINQFLKNKKLVFSVGIPIILIIIYGILVFSTKQKPQIIDPKRGITLAPTRVQIEPTTTKSQTNPPVRYNNISTEKMLDRLKNRIPLSTQDEATKQRIIKSINGRPSVLKTAPTFRVEYISSPDLFMVEVRTIDIGKGKSDARDWFVSQGFTPQGACELPVVYFLSSDVASQLRDLGISFSPLAEGC